MLEANLIENNNLIELSNFIAYLIVIYYVVGY